MAANPFSETRIVTTPSGVRLWSEASGRGGHPLLLIMGAMNPGLLWPEALCQRLVESGCRLIRYDHRDTGLSSIIDFERAPYTLDTLAEDALALLDGYRISRASLVGLSMGGYIAQMLAARFPERVDRLVLVSTTADHRPYMAATTGSPAGDAFLSPPAASFLASVRNAAQAGASPEESEQRALDVWRETHGGPSPFPAEEVLALMRQAAGRSPEPLAAFHHAAAVLAAPDRLQLVKSICAPTLVLHGRTDRCLPLDHGEYLARAIPGATLRVLAMGHMVFSDSAVRVADEVASFLAESTRQHGLAR